MKICIIALIFIFILYMFHTFIETYVDDLNNNETNTDNTLIDEIKNNENTDETKRDENTNSDEQMVEGNTGRQLIDEQSIDEMYNKEQSIDEMRNKKHNIDKIRNKEQSIDEMRNKKHNIDKIHNKNINIVEVHNKKLNWMSDIDNLYDKRFTNGKLDGYENINKINAKHINEDEEHINKPSTQNVNNDVRPKTIKKYTNEHIITKSDNIYPVPYDKNNKGNVIALKQWSQAQIDQKSDEKQLPYKCCKVFVDKEDNEYIYKYQKLKGDDCRPTIDNEPMINKTDYFYYTNEYMPTENMCSSEFKDSQNEPTIGSCRYNEMLCQDFHTKNSCSKLPDWIWSTVPCRMPVKRIPKVDTYDHYLLPNF